MKPFIRIAISTKADTTSWSVGDALIKLFTENSLTFPEFVSHNPDKFSQIFPGKDSCKDLWASVAQIRANGSTSEFHQDFCLRRKKAVKYRSSLSHRMINIRSQVVPASFDLSADWSDKIEWHSLFRSLCKVLKPQLAMLHLFTKSELCLIGENHNFAIGSFGAALDPKVYGVGWAMFYGDEFQKFDLKSIDSWGFEYEKIGDGYMVMATEKIGDILDDYYKFDARRNELKRHFPPGFFVENF
ncbi:hypothetical protein NB688_004183 [Xanthomonas sacchari]|uniref:Uncharacterized protein n=1 Tax=Xanthomonas sacchari TaxID=56458 RepID=A0ABT3DX74_9XANT|nr:MULTISPECIES: hypothetical protein [Xanthomonas]MCW0389739.1 hypothetical protein [Xanthomonas sacchari]MCW0399884.1 hypothetical protein [Xanthomonas sacchari]MCW0422017.1 hypothetical protein [Xanthomonas sacchari]MDQ7760263.1 hypothetical protein [Xanthomonas sontii]UYK72709.1 hypothetical protein NG828_21430 [Xanthomonas sacchari]